MIHVQMTHPFKTYNSCKRVGEGNRRATIFKMHWGWEDGSVCKVFDTQA